MTNLPIIILMKKTATCLLLLVLLSLSHQSFSQPSKKSGAIFKKSANLPAFTMNFNLVGIALYGPIIKAEFKVADRLFLAPMIRYSYAGVVSTYEWTNFEDISEYYPSSIAGGIGLKAFITVRTNKQYIYYGLFGEYIYEQGLHDTDEPNYEYEQTRTAVAVYGNLGYRWNSKRNFYLDLDILPGYAFDLKNEGIFTKSLGPVTTVEKKNRFIGMFDIAFGWNLGR